MNHTLTRTSVPCDCGGKRANIPDIVRRHNQTYKHSTWRFECLCNDLVEAQDHKNAVSILLKMRDLIRSGRVK